MRVGAQATMSWVLREGNQSDKRYFIPLTTTQILVALRDSDLVKGGDDVELGEDIGLGNRIEGLTNQGYRVPVL